MGTIGHYDIQVSFPVYVRDGETEDNTDNCGSAEDGLLPLMRLVSLGLYKGVDYAQFNYWCDMPYDHFLPEDDEWRIIFVPLVNKAIIKTAFALFHSERKLSRYKVAEMFMEMSSPQYSQYETQISDNIYQKILHRELPTEVGAPSSCLVLDGLMEHYPNALFPDDVKERAIFNIPHDEERNSFFCHVNL